MIINTYSSESYYYTGFKVLLKDENGVPIKLISSGFPYKFNGTTSTIETVSQTGIKKPIPYSISDITNNIEDYWSVPEGSLNISANGTYDVTNKAEAVVNVPNPSTGSLEITENGTYDVTDKASAVVAVSGGGGTPAPLPVRVFNRSYNSAAFSEDLAWTGATDAQSLIDRYLINVVLADGGRPLMTKNDGSFITVKELRGSNPLPNGSSRYSITAEEAQYAYDNGHMLAMTGDNGAAKDNTYFIMVKGTVIYWGNMYGIQSQTWANVFVRMES